MALEFLALEYQASEEVIQKCLDQTAKIHDLSVEDVMKRILGDVSLGDLPLEMIEHILLHLPTQDLLNLCQTSKQFAELCRSDWVWKSLLWRDFHIRGKGDPKKLYFRLFRRKKISCGTDIAILQGGRLKIVKVKDESLERAILPEYTDIIAVSNTYDTKGILTAGGKLYTWGTNRDGEVGTGDFSPVLEPRLLLEKIRYFSCGDTHGVAVSWNNKVYEWGYGIYNKVKPIKPSLVPFNEKISQVSCGSSITAVVTINGDIYTWSDKSPKLLLSKEIHGRRFIQVSCGTHHYGAVTDDGRLYLWGQNHNGELGIGIEDNTDHRDPTEVIVDRGKKVRQVSCGSTHTGAVTYDNELYMWGDNSVGQIGNWSPRSYAGGIYNSAVPYLINLGWSSHMLGKNPPIEQVSCGWGITAAIGTDRKVYIWGRDLKPQSLS